MAWGLSIGPDSSHAHTDAREESCRVRPEVNASLHARADVLFGVLYELAEALACTVGPLRSLPELSPVPPLP